MRKISVLLGIASIILIVGTWYAFTHSSSQLKYSSKDMALKLTSFSFEQGGEMPSKFTCDGDGVNPALSISDVPEGVVSFALVMEDPDVPKAIKPDGMFDHWTLFNIPPETRDIAQGKSVGTRGANGSGKIGYVGPCPPPNHEPSTHRYFFKLYALDTKLELPEGATKTEVLDAIKGHIIEQAELMGTYKRITQ